MRKCDSAYVGTGVASSFCGCLQKTLTFTWHQSYKKSTFNYTIRATMTNEDDMSKKTESRIFDDNLENFPIGVVHFNRAMK